MVVGRRALPGLRWVGLWLIIVVSVAGCGAPSYTYVTNSDDRTYLKIPPQWRQIDDRSLADAIGLDPAVATDQRGLWITAYDADAAPSPAHLFGPSAAAPAVLVSVQDIPAAARGQFSLDRLRDLFHPVSAAARQRDAASATSVHSDFALIGDDVLTPGDGLHGVHAIYRYRVAGGPLQIFDQTAYLNDDASKLYVFFLRCSTECYQERHQEIDTVVSSFTVREKP